MMENVMGKLKIAAGHLVVQQILCLLLAILLIVTGLTLMSLTNPTETIHKNITVSERQILSSLLVRNYYVITPENQWYQVYDPLYCKFQPGHNYSVQIRHSIPRDWVYRKDMTDDERKFMQEIDFGTRATSTADMIMAIDGENP